MNHLQQQPLIRSQDSPITIIHAAKTTAFQVYEKGDDEVGGGDEEEGSVGEKFGHDGGIGEEGDGNDG